MDRRKHKHLSELRGIMLKLPCVILTLDEKNALQYEPTGNDSNKAMWWSSIKKYQAEIKSYLKTFSQADKLADYVDGGDTTGPYSERIKRLPELLALVESMRTSESIIFGNLTAIQVHAHMDIYLGALTGLKTYQTFADIKTPDKGKFARVIHDGDAMSIGTKKQLESLNKLGAGVYLTVNETDGKGRAAENIIKVRACFADLDGVPLHPVWAYDPSMVVETSPGKYHAYWLTDDAFPLEGFTQVQEAIALTFNSDPKVKDLPRVLRMPGFYHNKVAPFLTRVIHHSGVKYSFTELVEMFPPAKKKQWSAPKYQDAKSVNDGEFKGHYGAVEGQRNCHITKRIGGMLKRGLSWNEIEQEAFREGMACSPPLSEKEVSLILKSCRRYA